jgi:hypothetical protein
MRLPFNEVASKTIWVCFYNKVAKGILKILTNRSEILLASQIPS